MTSASNSLPFKALNGLIFPRAILADSTKTFLGVREKNEERARIEKSPK